MSQGEWTKLDDAELVVAFKQRRVGAFEALVERHQRGLVNYFYRMSWDRQAAEDGAQEVFLRLYTHLDAYEPQAKFTTFLYRIARNLWIDRVRAGKVRGTSLSLEAPSFGDERTLGERIPGDSATPVENLSRLEREEALRRAIDRLPEEQKAVVTLSEIEGLKYQEISEILGVPVGTIKSRMHAAMEKLRDFLSDIEL